MANKNSIKPPVPLLCPECGARMVRRSSKYGLFYGCSRFPACDATHGCHQKTGLPLGVPADKETKRARMAAHEAFDGLWKGSNAKMSRRDAYEWLADVLGISGSECHIGCFDKAMCGRVVSACLKKTMMG